MTANMRLWESLARDFSQATGTECRILDVAAIPEEEFCPICSNAERKLGIRTACRELHLFSAYQSERWGGHYIYDCPLSGTYWASPIISGDMMSAAYIAGPVMLNPVDDFLFESIAERYLMRDRIGEVADLFRGIQVVAPSRISSLSEILRATALRGSESGNPGIFDDAALEQQALPIDKYLRLLTSMEGQKNSDLEYPLKLEHELLQHVARGDRSEAEDVLDRLMSRVLAASGVELPIIRSRILELVVLISRAAIEGGADVEQIFGLNYRLLNSIRGSRTVEELQSWLRRVIGRFCSLVFDLRTVKHTDTILRALRFMKENFYEKLTLADVAGQAGLSTDYFSRIFHAELKMTFSEYLNRLRIEEAKRLLRTGHQSLGNIAYACGFEDQSYFTRVFRKVVGETPSRYRDELNQIPMP